MNETEYVAPETSIFGLDDWAEKINSAFGKRNG